MSGVSQKNFGLNQTMRTKQQNSLYGVADPSLASSHWLWPDLDTPGCYLFFNDLILIMLNGGLGWTKMSNIWICECLDRLEHLDLDRLAHLHKLA